MTYLRERWAAGCHAATILWTELRGRGFSGSLRMVQRAVAGWRWSAPRVRGSRSSCDGNQAGAGKEPGDEAALPPQSLPAPARSLSPQQAVWVLLRPEEGLTVTEQTPRARLQASHDEIRVAHDLVARFRDLMRTRSHEQFTG
jgi:hypothetical protein